MSKPHNHSLGKARKRKNDEFFTLLPTIENELKHYWEHFKGKTIFCNCDDPKTSNFYNYLSLKFNELGLKKLITTHYDPNVKNRTYKLEVIGGSNNNAPIKTPLKSNGDFRSNECIDILKTCDIVITNPPFSLFLEYIAQLIQHKKKFLIIGNINAVDYKELFSWIQEGKVWLGVTNGSTEFRVPELNERSVEKNNQYFQTLGNICWFTNLEHKKRKEEMLLYKKYNPIEFPKYDNYDAIEVGKCKEIPNDYQGKMGVPISFLYRHNPKQFDIVSKRKALDEDGKTIIPYLKVNGKTKYIRLIIRRTR